MYEVEVFTLYEVKFTNKVFRHEASLLLRLAVLASQYNDCKDPYLYNDVKMLINIFRDMGAEVRIVTTLWS
jgi:hypothetical protein